MLISLAFLSHLIFTNFLSSRIVSTQLGADLTKQIVITDPYRIKVFVWLNLKIKHKVNDWIEWRVLAFIISKIDHFCRQEIHNSLNLKAPAERIPTEFHLPIGVQLLQVYIERKQFAKLMQEANNERYYNSCLDTVTKKILQRKVGIRSGNTI